MAGERMKRNFVVLLVIIFLIFGSAYSYLSSRVTDPFMIDVSKTTANEYAASLVGTKQDYYFRLQKTSDKSIDLIAIKLEGYRGIQVGPIMADGKAVSDLEVPSHRVYNATGWSTENQGIELHYEVTILEPKITNPQKVIITYKYMGLKHRQTVQLPGIQP